MLTITANLRKWNMLIKGFSIVEFLISLLIITSALLHLSTEQIFINSSLHQMHHALRSSNIAANHEEYIYAVH